MGLGCMTRPKPLNFNPQNLTFLLLQGEAGQDGAGAG
jgi:hypothetical protein